MHWCYSPQLCECFSNNQLDEAEVQAQIVRHQQEIDQTNPVYSCDDASGETEYHSTKFARGLLKKQNNISRPANSCSKATIKTLEQSVKSIQS